MEKLLNILDFAPGQKTVAFAIVYVLSMLGHDISQDDALATVTTVGIIIGNIGMTYGVVMKGIRKLRELYQKYFV